ncbi:MAG TPA: hypothetical protein VF659_04500 [Pyrinomonadaceae bacterium]|jgi:hypothetical protein
MPDCNLYRREIVEEFDGAAMSRGARAHAESCRACGEELRGSESLRALVRGLDKVEAPADFDFRLRARMAAAGTQGRGGPLKGLRLVYAFAPVAAALCFLVVTTSLYFRQAARTSAPAAPPVAASAPARAAEAGKTAATSAGVTSEESKRSGVRPSEIASSSAGLPVNPPARMSRAASRPSRDVAASQAARAAVPQRNTTIASLTAAQVITGRGVPFRLETPAETMRMVLWDERGAGRVVPMRSVSFGSQELIARENVSRQASAAENEGVW